jgi:hypothetical protein
MSGLRLDLDKIHFKELADLGRSMIPTVAPNWTDHNVHDPGIMLMELIAWTADAQVYALSRESRGERAAYGRLLGLELTGPRPATGLVWPFAADAAPGTPVPWAAGTVVGLSTAVTADRPQAPAFNTARQIELTTASLTQLTTRFADGTTRDWTRANTQQGATFLPFGENPQKGDRLTLTLEGTLVASPASGAPISIGFEIVSDPPWSGTDGGGTVGAGSCSPVRLRVSLGDSIGPWPISIAEDTTAGLSHSGVLLLAVDPAVAGRSGRFTLTVESESGSFLLPPRVQRTALNVLPVQQVRPVFEAAKSFGRGTLDQSYLLQAPGLMFPVTDRSFRLWVSDGTTLQPWTRIDDLTTADPEAPVYVLAAQDALVTFGNGINGRMPQAEADLSVEYLVTAGAAGNVPRGIQWTVSGVPAPFGSNSEPTSGGADALGLDGLRATARSRVLDARPIVTMADLQSAARAFTDLDVRRALELPPGTGAPRVSGSRILVAVGPHDSQPNASSFTESALWLAEVRRRLVPRLPLGQGLEVIGPRLIDVGLTAHVAAARQLDIDEVRDAIRMMLEAKLAITTSDGSPVWPFNRDITLLTVKGWLRNLVGVARVFDITLRSPNLLAGGDRVALGAIELPRLQVASGDITVDRSPVGGAA